MRNWDAIIPNYEPYRPCTPTTWSGGVTAGIAEIWYAVEQYDLVPLGRSILDRVIANAIPVAWRCVSYHPGDQSRRAYYGQDTAFAERATVEALRGQAAALGLRPWPGQSIMYVSAGRGVRRTYRVRGRRWVPSRTYRRRTDDGVTVWECPALARRVHGLRVTLYLPHAVGAYRGYLVEGRGWSYHVESLYLRSSWPDGRREAVRYALRERRRQIEADAKRQEVAARARTVWVTRDLLARVGACSAGIDAGRRWIEATLGAAGEVGAVRADWLLETPYADWARRAVSEAAG